MHGSKQMIDITSEPSNASVTIDGIDYGKTPLYNIPLNRKGKLKGQSKNKKSYTIEIVHDNFLPYQFTLKRELDQWYMGNLVGGVGLLVDAVNGSMYNLTPERTKAQTNGVISYTKVGDSHAGIHVKIP